jgi:cobalt-zinc-cadmium efflux system protein
MAWALGIAAVYMVAEIVGGLVANSLALLADAGHMATDVAALGLALWAMRLARKPPTAERTYGYHRAEILAALANGALLVAITIYIFWEAWKRLQDPPEVAGPTMMAVAVGGLIVNGIGILLLKGGRKESLNVRGAWLHVLGDALGSVAVIVGAALVWAFGWEWADPVAGGLIGVLILYSAWRLVRESVGVLMAGVPEGLDIERLRRSLEGVNGVTRIHDLHVWTLTSGIRLLTAHVEVKEETGWNRVVNAMCEVARDEFGIHHCTIQPEQGPCTNRESDI